MDCKVGSEHSLWNPPSTSVGQLFKEKRIWVPNPGEDCIRGENSSLKIKKKNLFVYKTWEGNELTWDLASLCSAAISSLWAVFLEDGWSLQKSDLREEKGSQEEAPSLSTPQNQQLWNLHSLRMIPCALREGPRNRQHQKEELGHPVPGPALSLTQRKRS